MGRATNGTDTVPNLSGGALPRTALRFTGQPRASVGEARLAGVNRGEVDAAKAAARRRTPHEAGRTEPYRRRVNEDQAHTAVWLQSRRYLVR